MVTMTGPGGVGKTRLAIEVARRVASRFADGAWLVDLAAVHDPEFVPAAVASALGLRPIPGMPLTESVVEVLADRQLLLVMDNCEHLAQAVAELLSNLLARADDIWILATSRQRIGLAGEARHEVPPLSLLGQDGAVDRSEAIALFADRAREADPHFTLDDDMRSMVGRLVSRLDGMPLAIELAAARVLSLGVQQLLDRLDDRFRLLVGGDRAAKPQQRSLAATVDWSYQLLTEPQRQVFRQLSVFPGPFTLDAAETVSGSAAAPLVLDLVDCSLLCPPRIGADGLSRYHMLETLRAYGADQLAEAGELEIAAAAMAEQALRVAEQATTKMQASGGEIAAAHSLDAEDATLHLALTWALDCEHATALRLALALAPWWRLRGRFAAGYTLLTRACERAASGSHEWSAAQTWLGHLAHRRSDFGTALGHFTAARDALTAEPSTRLVDALTGMSGALRNLDRLADAEHNACRALTLAKQLGYLAGEATALTELSWAASYADDAGRALAWARDAQRVDASGMPDWTARTCGISLTVALMHAGQAAAAQQTCADGLARARQAGDLHAQADWLYYQAEIEMQAGSIADARTQIKDALDLATLIGDRMRVLECLDACGHICAATGRSADAVTIWAACGIHGAHIGLPAWSRAARRRRAEVIGAATRALGAADGSAAEERGALMTMPTATEFASMAASAEPGSSWAGGLAGLTAREQELVRLVAMGRTDAQIAEHLYISIRTVRSHLDRIRDKSGCRRRADLTRLALDAGLVLDPGQLYVTHGLLRAAG